MAQLQEEVWPSGYIADQLFLEMCEHGPMIDDTNSLLPLTGLPAAKINKYYLEAAKYAGRVSAGDFSDPGTPKPVFKLDISDLSYAASSVDRLKEGWHVKPCRKGSYFQVIQSTAQNDIL